MHKTAAIRLARAAIPPAVATGPTQFTVRVPADARQPQGEFVVQQAASYIEAQHLRAFAICRVALAHMGLHHVALSPKDGGTVEQLMRLALYRARHGSDAEAMPNFWQIRLNSGDPP